MNREKIERALDACCDAISASKTWLDARLARLCALNVADAFLFHRNPQASIRSFGEPVS